MDMKDRLRKVLGLSHSSQTPCPEDGAPSIPGDEVVTDLGAYWLNRVVFPLNYQHGDLRVRDALDLDPQRICQLTSDPSLKTFDPRDAVFIDTETTSLSGGAGVNVFMAGAGFFTDQGFCIEQYFMRDYDEELPMIFAFNERVGEYAALVSYFGKNFDRYRLEDRMTLLGIQSKMPVKRHLDLYHASRRIFQNRFSDLKLKTLEACLLGFERQGDIPGAQCPEAWFSYVRGEDEGQAREVFEHNLWDILSLATLCAKMDQTVKNPQSDQEKYRLACALLKGGWAERATRMLEEIHERLTPEEDAVDACLKLLKIYKQKGAMAEVEGLLKKLNLMRPNGIPILIESAKYWEHKKKEFSLALEFALKAKKAIEDSNGPLHLIKEAAHRIERLQRKAGDL